MSRYVVGLSELDRSHVEIAGGKGANLGELTRIAGIPVPDGFCVTTEAFDEALAMAPSVDDRLNQLSTVPPDDLETIRALAAELRSTLEAVTPPAQVASDIADALARLGADASYAVRSSATEEDLPTASFAGQQDTYLNVIGPKELLKHVCRCWASLFTDRAVIYRARNGFDHRKAHMAVVVQRMVQSQAAGILFTADPITSNRKIASIEASFGLGEALVSGRVNPDVFKVRDGAIVDRTIAAKRLSMLASPSGGTVERAVEPSRQQFPSLQDPQVLHLVELGRKIEAHFGRPQDIEWCLADGALSIVQSRPITTLFPLPAPGDGSQRVYLSVGHQQMMTDAMKPLGLSFWQMTTPRPMLEAGGRLFADATSLLTSLASRTAFLEMIGRSDPLTRDALQTLFDRGDFTPSSADPATYGGAPAGEKPPPIPTDPSIVAALVSRNQASVAALKRDIQSRSGTALLDFLAEDIQELRRLLFDPRSHQAIMAGMEATWWLNDQLGAWLGEKNAADALAQSVPDNVTSAMGLELLDVADAIRPHPAVVDLLSHAREGDTFIEDLAPIEGGREARAAIVAYLEKYGMRCAGEIDITRPRWSEQPSALLPTILTNVRSFDAGEGARRFEQGRRAAQRMAEEVIGRLRALPDGDRKADETQRMIDRVRTFSGYREYPKYGMVSRYAIYRKALLQEAKRLVQMGVLREVEDLFYLTFAALREVVNRNEAPAGLIRERRDEFRWFQSLTPPRVLTSDGECLSGSYRRTDVPRDALVGLAVSAGVIEGRARVFRDVGNARLEVGDILVTAYTDPSWTPLFVGIAGLVTEVGGLMTHGSVIAREYGLPAIVGVEEATRRIPDGHRIRLNGTDGYVELLP